LALTVYWNMAKRAPNTFRSNWRYMRLPAGDAMLQAGKGLSPAFMKLLAAIDPRTTITFDELSDAFPAMDADDLELWLAELCRMELISPAEPPGVGLREVHLELVEGGQTEAQAEEQTAPEPAQAAPEPAPARAATPAKPAGPVLPASDHTVSVLLVDKSPEERELWRAALAVLPVNLYEAGTLAEADSGFREHKPQAVVMGMTGVDFKALHLLGLLKHPRNRIRTKVFLMLEDKTVSQNDLRTAQMADATIPTDGLGRLVEEVAGQLALTIPEPAAAPAPPPKDSMSVTQRLLYAGNPDAANVMDPNLLSSLEQRYPRVTLELVERWGKPSLEGFLDNLILDSRGNRQGFAPEAMEELLLLYNVHREYRPANEFWYQNAEAQSRGARPDKLGTTGANKRLR
jgi:CheY-like chemotaxis protein